jgi:hypothetical protein
MSIRIDVHASDVSGLDEQIERTLNVGDYYGTALFDDDGRLVSQDGYEYFIEPKCYLGLMMDMQQQITELREDAGKLKVSDHINSSTLEVLLERIKTLESNEDSTAKTCLSLYKRVKVLENERSDMDAKMIARLLERVKVLEKEVEKL